MRSVQRPSCRKPCGAEFELVSKRYQHDLPTFCVIATGGTIQAGAESPKEKFYYENGPAYGKTLFDQWASITDYNILVYQPWNIGSHEIKMHHTITLAKIVLRCITNGADGILVTHGTDTMVDTASIIQWLIGLHMKDIPIVFTGASNPSLAECSDGPENLDDALAVLANGGAKNRGVMILMNRLIFLAEHAIKYDAGRIGGLGGPEYGSVLDGRVSFHYAPSVSGAHSIPLDKVVNSTQRAVLVMGYQGIDTQALEAVLDTKPEAVVAAGVGDGWFSEDAMAILQAAAAEGMIVIAAARSGRMARTTLEKWQIPCYDLDYSKCLALTRLALWADYNHSDIRALLDGSGDEGTGKQGERDQQSISPNALVMSLRQLVLQSCCRLMSWVYSPFSLECI
ncbi:unnamed protein product [Clonostachys solani]|uniref:asparaginase n=1 Tax=Clonostachys solani TaxID=160281 RepID=A0A9N9ZEL6_9HYPO|nr:unnamed protein product [Clonostachys solani]